MSNVRYSPRRALVTGGAGFIGANFLHYFLRADRDVQVVNLDSLTYAGDPASLEGLPDPRRHTFVRGNIRDETLVRQILDTYEIDTVIHFAAESHVDRSIAGPRAFLESNVEGTFVLLESARHYWNDRFDLHPDRCRFHHVSTDEVYGSLSADDPPFTEDSPYAPNSPYSATKAASDHLVRAYQHTYGLPTTTSNCSNNYGPRQHPEKFIPTIISCCLKGKPIPVYGAGTNIRDWLFVDDHCRGVDCVIRLAETGQTYNVGGDNEKSNLQICVEICRLMDICHPSGSPHERLISFVSDRPGHDWRYAIDARKIKRDLAWAPTESFESGIKRTVGWYVNRFQ